MLQYISVEIKLWAVSDNGSTVALQASGRGSIPRRSTIVFFGV